MVVEQGFVGCVVQGRIGEGDDEAVLCFLEHFSDAVYLNWYTQKNKCSNFCFCIGTEYLGYIEAKYK